MRQIHPHEFKVMSLRDCPVPSEMLVCETPQQVVDYWRLHIATAPHFNPECECMAVLMLNTRKRVAMRWPQKSKVGRDSEDE